MALGPGAVFLGCFWGGFDAAPPKSPNISKFFFGVQISRFGRID